MPVTFDCIHNRSLNDTDSVNVAQPDNTQSESIIQETEKTQDTQKNVQNVQNVQSKKTQQKEHRFFRKNWNTSNFAPDLAGTFKKLYQSKTRPMYTNITRKYIWDMFIVQVNSAFQAKNLKLSSSGNKEYFPKLYLYLVHQQIMEDILHVECFSESRKPLEKLIQQYRRDIAKMESKLARMTAGKLSRDEITKFAVWKEYLESNFHSQRLLPENPAAEIQKLIAENQDTVSIISDIEQVLLNIGDIESMPEEFWLRHGIQSQLESEIHTLRCSISNNEDKITRLRALVLDTARYTSEAYIDHFQEFLQNKLDLAKIKLKCAEEDLNRVINIVREVRKQVRKLNYIVPCPYTIEWH
jgi:hypothetical protein